MIKQIKYKNLKCLAKNTLTLRELTVLCGGNSSGKSTAIQGLLLANQAAMTGKKKNLHISINNINGLDLGVVADLTSNQKVHNLSTITIEIIGDLGACEFKFNATPSHQEETFLTGSIRGEIPKNLGIELDVVYLSAERQGPREIYPLQFKPESRMVVGHAGQYVAEVLATFDRLEIQESRRLPKSNHLQTLQLQVESWISEWVPNTLVKAVRHDSANIAELRFSQKGIETEWRRPANVGFGISYSLPVVVAGLLAKPGSILIVDTPEAHLHPAGQSAIADFLARVAASGVQVLIETHSDHIINGIRLAAVRPDHPIKSSQIVINNSLNGKNQKGFLPIDIDKYGGLTEWPKGFLDQTELDLGNLANTIQIGR